MPINLTATPSMQNGQIVWSLCDSFGKCGSAPSTYPSIDLGTNAPPTTVTITINDPNHLGISFAAGQNAMWVQPSSAGCPQTYVWNPLSQILSPPTGGSTAISFTDQNSNSGALSLTYRLNFVNAQNQSVTPLDPIIRNGGKGIIYPAPNPTTLLIESAFIALIVSLIVSLIVVRMVGRNARSGPQ